MFLVKNLFLIIDTYICLKIESQVFETVIYRNPKETDLGWIKTRPFSSHWVHFKENMFEVGLGVGH